MSEWAISSGAVRTALASIAFVIFGVSGLPAKTILVPGEIPTIKSAVLRAEEGDVILVDDGVYLETNIVVDKAVRIRARHPYGAVIYGSMRSEDFIFEIRAAAEIEGFIFKRGQRCLVQRHSPDVVWKARDVAMFDFGESISVNAVEGNVGCAIVEDILIVGGVDFINSSTGVSTNDANSLEVRRAFILATRTALSGYNHISFRVEDSVILGCETCVSEGTRYRPVPPGTAAIERENVDVLDFGDLTSPDKLRRVLASLDRTLAGPGLEAAVGAGGGTRGAIKALVTGDILASMGRAADAEAKYLEALTAAKGAGSNELAWLALLGSARLSESLGQAAEAAETYRVAIGLVERWLSLVPAGLFRINFLEDKIPAHESLIRILLGEGGEDSATRAVEEAFRTSEKMKSLAALRILKAGAQALAANAEELTARKKAARAISTLQTALQDPGLSGERKEELCSSLERAEEEWNALLLSYRRSSWNSRPLESSAAWDGGRIREEIGDRMVLSFVLGEKASFAFLVGKDVIRAARLPARAEVEALVESYLEFLRVEGTKRFRGWKGGKILHDLLLGPFRKELESGPREIIIIPCGRLHYLPFEALVEEEGENGAEGRFWGENRAIIYAPTLRSALADGIGRRGPDGPLLALGYSGGTRCDNRTRNLKQLFPPLSYVKREVRTVSGFFPRADVRTLLGAKASEARFKQLGLSGFGVVHIATHGIIDDVRWWRSALLLEPDARVPEDGLLTALEISELDLNASLVVLSSCETGLGSLYRGGGIRGLAGAFRAAGAKDLVVSLWSVDDKATSVFMRNFYQLLTRGASPAAALRETKLRMIDSKYANPRFWAPFVLIGTVDRGER